MSFFEICVIAMALAADAFSVALVVSMQGCISWKQISRMSAVFGFFQFFMPLVGFFLYSNIYSTIHDYVAAYDHIIVFLLLAAVGGKMLWEGYTYNDSKDTYAKNNADPTTGLTLLSLAFATSIDALAVGTTFAAQGIQIWMPAIIIGIVCALMTLCAMFLSRRLLQNNTKLAQYAYIIGGIVLVGIGLKNIY